MNSHSKSTNPPQLIPIINIYDTPISEEAIEQFRMLFKGRIIRKEDEAYEESRKVWNGMIDKKHGLIAYCTGVADVIQAVNLLSPRIY